MNLPMNMAGQNCWKIMKLVNTLEETKKMKLNFDSLETKRKINLLLWHRME